MKIFDQEFKGLSQNEVLKRIQDGKTHFVESKSTKTYQEIIINNIFTFFNFINIILFACIIFVGSYRNTLFISVVFFNTLTGIYQEIKAKKTLDKLSILTKQKIEVLRDNRLTKINVEEIVQDDFIILNTGMQIPVDCTLLEGHVEANESLLTGESDAILKVNGDSLLSGSFVTSGRAICKVTHVGKESYIHKLTAQAKEFDSKKSELSQALDQILKIISIILIPIAFLLFCKEFFIGHYPFSDTVVSVVAAVLGMIPSGLVLLTTIALSLSLVRLAKKSTLVQNLFCIETLARVDTICLDKTGTLTEGKLKVDDVICLDDSFDLEKIIKNLNYCLEDANMTSQALNQRFSKEKNYQPFFVIPFSSQRKYSAVSFCDFGTIYLGASQFIFSKLDQKIKGKIQFYTSKGYRVLCIGYTPTIINENRRVNDLKCIGFLILSDVIRKDAKETLDYFRKQDVQIKIISGDDPSTVSAIARRCHLLDYEKYIDVSSLPDEEIKEAVEKYTIFGRVSPQQKKLMITTLQENEHTVAMTGDGVNDILAIKKADCSIAMGSGSDAARQAAQVVLLDSNFSHLNDIVSEGRRDINNITRSATLFLYKNMFSLFLAVFSIINSFSYPLKPSQISLVSMFNIGIPSFFLALEANEDKQSGHFITQTVLRALPASLTSFASIAALVVFAQMFHLPDSDIGTASTYLLSIVGFIILIHLSSPFNKYRGIVFTCCLAGFLLSLTWLNDLFAIEALSLKTASLCVVFALAEVTVMRYLTKLFTNIRKFIEKKCNKA